MTNVANINKDMAEIMVNDFAANEGWTDYDIADIWQDDDGTWYVNVVEGGSDLTIECSKYDGNCYIVEER